MWETRRSKANRSKSVLLAGGAYMREQGEETTKGSNQTEGEERFVE